MENFGTSQDGTPLQIEMLDYDASTGPTRLPNGITLGSGNTHPTQIVSGTETIDTLTPSYGDTLSNVYADLGPGLDIVDYSGSPDGVYLSIHGVTNGIMTARFNPSAPDATNSDFYEYDHASDTVENVETIIGTEFPDDILISDCDTSIKTIDGRGQTSAPSNVTDGDSLRLGRDIGPVDWVMETDTRGAVRGAGVNVSFSDIENVGFRAGDTVHFPNGEWEVMPGTPPSDLSEYPSVCEPAQLSQFLQDAETRLAAYDNPTEFEQTVLDTLHSSDIAGRVSAMADAGVESMDVPSLAPNYSPIEQVVVIAGSAETQALQFELEREQALDVSETNEANTPEYDLELG